MSTWPNRPEAARPAPVREPRPRRGLSFDIILLTIAGAMALAYGIKVLSNPSAEIGEWHYAAALEKWADGDREAAITSLSKAIEWNAAEPYFYVQRAEWRRQTDHAEAALQDIDTVIAELGEKPPLLVERSLILQHLGRHAEAVKLLQSAYQQSGDQKTASPNRLNSLAYARALAKVELPKALADIDQALKLEPNEAALLDTRGFVLFQQGKHSEALADLDAAVRKAEKELPESPLSQAAFRRQQVDIRQIDEALGHAKRNLAVMLYHRALALNALGRGNEAKADLVRARELIGKEPDESLF